MTDYTELLRKGVEKRRTTRRTVNAVMLGFTGVLTVLALVPLFWIIGYIVHRGGQSINLDFFTQLPKPMGMEGGGVLHAIEGTLIVTLMATIIAFFPGVLAAFYASRNPNTPLGIALWFSTDVLSGVPSIIVGLFGYALIVKPQGHYSALAGSIALAILMLPTIIRTTEEMLKLVPTTLREASLALGAAEWKTSLSVLLPAALDGVITGVLLAIARAAGETAPLLFTTLGNERFDLVSIVKSGITNHQPFFQILSRIFSAPIDSLPLTLWKYAQQPYPERIEQSWAVALVLMILVLTTNIVSRVWIDTRKRKLRG